MQTDILCKYGVYKFLGLEIPNCKELGLQEDKIYQVKKDGEFIKKMYESIIGKKIPVYLRNPFIGYPVGEIENTHLFDGIITHSIKLKSTSTMDKIKEDSLFFSAPLFAVSCKIESGNYMGVGYDLVMTNPEIHSVALVEKVREAVKLPD